MNLEKIIARISEITLTQKLTELELTSLKNYLTQSCNTSFSRKLPNGVLVEWKDKLRGVVVETVELREILEEKRKVEQEYYEKEKEKIYELESTIVKANQQLSQLRSQYLGNLDSKENKEIQRIKNEKVKALGLSVNLNGYFKDQLEFQSFSEEYKRTQENGEYTRIPEMINKYLASKYEINE